MNVISRIRILDRFYARFKMSLVRAIIRRRPHRVWRLLQQGANPNKVSQDRLPLDVAVETGQLDTVQMLLQWGADPNMGIVETPLHTAVRQDDREMVLLLLGWSADPNIVNIYGETPAMIASLRGHLDILEILTETL